MNRAHSLELVLRPEHDVAIRAAWQALEAAGVPSLARHRGLTHRPHVTVATSPTAPDAQTLGRAERLWAPLLPLRLEVVGVALLGRRRLTLASLLAVPVSARAAQLELAVGWSDSDHRPWLPHLSLASHLPLGDAGQALAVLAHGSRRELALPSHLEVAGLRWWNPEAGDVSRVAGIAA